MVNILAAPFLNVDAPKVFDSMTKHYTISNFLIFLIRFTVTYSSANHQLECYIT